MAPKNWEDEFPSVKITPPNITYRSEWDARPMKEGTAFLPLPTPEIFFVSSGGDECFTDEECVSALQALQDRDMDERGMPDIQYNYYIGGNGVVYEGRGWHVKSTKEPRFAHLHGISIDMAFIGDFETKDPPDDMTLAASLFLKYLLENGYVSEQFEMTPLGLSRTPEDGAGESEEKHTLYYPLVRDPNTMRDEQPGLPEDEHNKALPYGDVASM